MSKFVDAGPLPSEDAEFEEIADRESELHAISAPVTVEEAELLAGCFGPDGCHGVAWSLLHVIESAPVHPLRSAPAQDGPPWLTMLWERLQNAG
ncbi:hypothetical protein [Microtetraspora glauca]|uniref:Uncharacterized protein n=1 Tax=Microtetraspora glauca TaxID=1996 RepID=A0ABV3GRN0_MICGL